MSELRPYSAEADLVSVLRFVGQGNVLAAGCGWLHPGDICHNLTRVQRVSDPEPYLYWYAEDGRIIALVMFYSPRMARYNILIHPEHRGGDLERGLLEWASKKTWLLMQEAEVARGAINIWVMNCDTVRQRLVVEQGYAAADEPNVAYTTRSLMEPVPDSGLPDGFTIRAVAGEQESVALGEVHSRAFGSDWSNNAYLAVMRSLAYSRGRELMVVAPDGRLAAFLIYWLDPISKSGLFEPVGCHPNFQRRGLMRSLMYEGMRRMRAGGMTSAVVKHHISSEPASALYAAVGFRRKYTIFDYHKARSTE